VLPSIAKESEALLILSQHDIFISDNLNESGGYIQYHSISQAELKVELSQPDELSKLMSKIISGTLNIYDLTLRKNISESDIQQSGILTSSKINIKNLRITCKQLCLTDSTHWN